MTDSAAFFRFEGTLATRPTLATAAWLAANGQGLGERLARLGSVALASPFVFAGPLHDPTVGSRMAWMGLRELSEDRLTVLGEDYADEVLIPNLRDVGIELLDQARRDGHRLVLLSDNLDVVVRPVARHLGVDDVVANRMEFRAGKATGRLLDPVIGGAVAGKWAQSFANEHAIDLGRSLGYGAQRDDSMLLSAIGHPCAVHPDRALRQLARELEWPVVDR